MLHGVDLAAKGIGGVVRADLAREPIPFADDFFDVVTAYDFIEHIPRICISAEGTKAPFIILMNEIHRVLKPGGLFFSKTPAFPFTQAFQDPTHVNVITEDTWGPYFCSDTHHPLAAMYGFKGQFNMISQKWWGGGWLLALMRKPL